MNFATNIGSPAHSSLGTINSAPIKELERYNEEIYQTQVLQNSEHTSLSLSIKNLKELSTAGDYKEDTILSQVDGVIVRTSEESVRVKLPNDIIANFPLALFNDKTKIVQGQHIRYQIKRDREGYRYQEIIVHETEHNPKKDEILKLLDSIRIDNE